MKTWSQKRIAAAVGFALGSGLVSLPFCTYAEETASQPMYELAGVTVEAARPDWEEKLSPGTVTVIETKDFKGEQKTLPDMLKTVPGVHVREVNGKGQYTTVTVRGSTAAQVGIFMDGILTNLGGDAAVDISTIPVKNIERIEVYRGYVPARFGGTFIGGVINIVTKKPDKAGIVAEMGKSSYGGKSLAMEYTAPVGSGTLLVMGNYESSDGDFAYTNYAAERYIPELERGIASDKKSIDNFDADMVDFLNGYDSNGVKNKTNYLNWSQSTRDSYKEDNAKWKSYLYGTGDDSLSGALTNYYEKNLVKTELGPYDVARYAGSAVDPSTGKSVSELLSEAGVKEADYARALSDAWNNPYGFSGGYNYTLTPSMKQALADAWQEANPDIKLGEADPAQVQAFIDKIMAIADPEQSVDLASYKKALADKEKRLQESKNAKRWRKYNSYKNGSAMIKWQNENWTVKGSWNKIDRYLPDGVWGDDAYSAVVSNGVDLYDKYYFDKRHQKLTNTEIMVQNRNQNGRLEWGWTADYLHQKKSYRSENIMWEAGTTDFQANNIPLREWSRYTSNKYNLQMDGSYKLSERSMLDFQANFSHERLKINGSLMDKVLGDSDLASVLGQTRNRYDQDIFNIQLQDTITLDKDGTFFLTPSLRYNRSKITGYSDGKRFAEGKKNFYHWLTEKDSQTDGKMTWQLALKKKFNDRFTMRMTGGTYYRLLNMYEIAGDGAGILPMTNRDGTQAFFPRPEEGKQFDVSGLWTGRILNANNSTTLTYFWRDSDNMLQLVRAGKDYWCYFNDNRGKAHGFEFQSNFNWNKFDLELRATYMKTHMQRKNTVAGHDYSDIWATYQPEWETNVRLTYRPNRRFDIFGEVHYMDEYFTNYSKDTRGGEYAYLKGRPVASLTTVNAGIKWKPSDSWQLAFGCNDIFNKAPEMKIRSQIAFTVPGYINPEFPIQGRTYYATLRYQF